MSIEIVYADRGMIHYIVQNLRQIDCLEMEAAGIDFDTLAEVIMRHCEFAFCACDDDYGPVATWGMVMRRTGVGAGFAFGTDQWRLAVRPMIRQIRDFVIPYLVDAGFHRVEAAAMSDREDVSRLMHAIGAEKELVIRGYGINGENFTSYRWLNYEHAHESASTSQHSHASH